MDSLAQQLRGIASSGAWRLRQSVCPAGQWRRFHSVGRQGVYFAALSSALSAGDASPRADARRSRLEAVLFIAREPLTLRKLAQLANLTDGTEARTLLAKLRARYDERGCAFQVVQVAGGYQLLSRREFAAWLRPQGGTEREIRLSPPALETLAVVAYRQPVLRSEVEAIRGVACGEILRQLMDRDLLRIVGRSEELGRPLRYGTTKRFLQVFGLCNLDDLPWAERLRRASTAEPSGDDFSATSGDSATGLTDDVDAA
jgi:segregation and condensation protein B